MATSAHLGTHLSREYTKDRVSLEDRQDREKLAATRGQTRRERVNTAAFMPSESPTLLGGLEHIHASGTTVRERPRSMFTLITYKTDPRISEGSDATF